MTTISTPARTVLFRRKISRISRFARFLRTASPSFLRRDDAEARLPVGRRFRSSVKYRLRIPVRGVEDLLELGPAQQPAVLPELRSGSRLELRHWCQDRGNVELPGRSTRRCRDASVARLARRDREALAALGAATLQNLPALLRAHAHEEPVGLRAAAAIRLKRALHGSRYPCLRNSCGRPSRDGRRLQPARWDSTVVARSEALRRPLTGGETSMISNPGRPCQ